MRAGSLNISHNRPRTSFKAKPSKTLPYDVPVVPYDIHRCPINHQENERTRRVHDIAPHDRKSEPATSWVCLVAISPKYRWNGYDARIVRVGVRPAYVWMDWCNRSVEVNENHRKRDRHDSVDQRQRENSAEKHIIYFRVLAFEAFEEATSVAKQGVDNSSCGVY